MKKYNYKSDKSFRPSLRQISVIGIVIAVSIGMGSYIYVGAGQAQPGTQKNPIISHIHTNLTITMDDKPLVVPKGIGMNQPLWKDHSLDDYGMQAMAEMGMPGMSPLHTHDDSGIIHVESSINRNYMLDEFLKVWGLDLNGKTVKATVNGKIVPDYKNIVLKDEGNILLGIKP